MATVDIETAWESAERAVYLKLVEATGAEDGDSSFLGAEPDTDVVDWWALFTGGGDADSEYNNCFSAPKVQARITGVFRERSDALRTAGRVYRLLRDTTNLKRTQGTNIQWFRMREHPQVEAQPGEDWQTWRLNIPCELVFAATTTY